MEDSVKVHMSCDNNFCIRLDLECPSCHARQSLPTTDLHTGIGFNCPCGDEFPISVAALYPVQQELDEVQRLVHKAITLPI